MRPDVSDPRRRRSLRLLLTVSAALALLLALVPVVAILPILLYIGMLIGAQAFQTTPQMIDLWRFIACIGLGVELVNVDAYLSELVPKA